MLRPLPDLDNPEGMAKLGRLYALREAWRDAVTQLRDSVSMIQSTHSDAQAEGLKQAREAVERMDLIQAAMR